MSRIRILGASLIATALGTGAAFAADIYAAPAPAPEAAYAPTSAYDWTGAYVGGILGYGWGQANGAGADRDANGFTGGVYGGYNWQVSPNFVVGGEADITGSGMEGKGNGVKVNNPWNSTFRAKAGFTMDRFMLYGTGGLSVGEVEVKKTIGRQLDKRSEGRLDARRRRRGADHQHCDGPSRVSLSPTTARTTTRATTSTSIRTRSSPASA